MINTQLQKLIENPEKLSLDGDRFAQYCKSWDEEKTLSKVWDDLDFSFFPLKSGKELITAIRSISDDYDAIIENISSIKAPYLLYMLLWYSNYTFEQYLQILQKSPPSDQSIKSIFTPVVLYMAVNEVIRHAEDVDSIENAEEINVEKIKEKFQSLSNVLKNRSEGFQLAFNYIQYILEKNMSRAIRRSINRLQTIESILCEVFIASFKNEAKSKLSYFDEATSEVSKTNIEAFRTFGTLAKESEDNSLVTFFTKCFFLQSEEDDSEEEKSKKDKMCLEEFQNIFVTNDRSFFTHDFQSYNKHIYVANIFLNQTDALKTWKDFHKFMSAARNRTSFSYFGDEQMDLRYHFKFMFIVSLRMLDKMLSEGKVNDIYPDFWKEFWREGTSYARRFAFAREDFIEKYLSMLILYAMKLHQRSNFEANDITTILISSFQDISNMPYIISLSLKELEDNGFKFGNFVRASCNDMENIEFFKNTFSATKGIIENKRQEEDLWLFINKCNQLLLSMSV